MLQLARLFLANAQGGPLAQMKITPELPLSHNILGFIAVHTTLVLSCQSKNLILHPFVSMMSNIAALQVSCKTYSVIFYLYLFTGCLFTYND